MAVTIEEAKAFIRDATKDRDNWLQVAKRSWDEIKKRQPYSNRIWSIQSAAVRKRGKYPAWYSIYKIRQQIVFSRIGIPIGKDTTQAGTDPLGATAAILVERLAESLARSFDFFDVMCACRDDFLVTDFGECRAYYSREEVREYKKEYIYPQLTDTGDSVIFYNEAGKEITSDDIRQDQEGYFIHTPEVVDVEDEKVCLEPVLYSDCFVDPGVRRWERVKRLAFRHYYSEADFKRIFGTAAFVQLSSAESQKQENDNASPKKQMWAVYEYWDEYEKECFWFCDESKDFFKPKIYPEPSDYDDQMCELNGIYNLSEFFPCPKPLIVNAPTDEFWPVPEYYQIIELTENIHLVFSRALLLTRAIRARLIFDKDIEGLGTAINEAEEADAVGVPNFSATLTKMGGDIRAAAQYLPIEELINGLAKMYESLEITLESLFRLTGTSDLLQGLSQSNSDKTLGERQMEEKYALNQVAERQKRMSEFVRDSYQLLVEMALKNFKQESLDKYIMPETLEEEDKQRYTPALELLKNCDDRFRVELETDSTIAINENYDKQMRIELVNVMTASLEKVAAIAEGNPALVVPELHALKFLIQGFRQAKLFQNEITQAIDNVIKQAEEAPPAFDPAQAEAEMKQAQMQAELKLKEYELLSNERMQQAKLAIDQKKLELDEARIMQEDRIAAIQAQIDSMAMSQKSQDSAAELQLQYQKLAADIEVAQAELETQRGALAIEMEKISDKKESDIFNAQMAAQVAQHEIALNEAQLKLEEYRVVMDEKEKLMTEQRLQSEHELEKMTSQIDMLSKIAEQQRPAEGK